jgi:hypothetical protein
VLPERENQATSVRAFDRPAAAPSCGAAAEHPSGSEAKAATTARRP